MVLLLVCHVPFEEKMFIGEKAKCLKHKLCNVKKCSLNTMLANISALTMLHLKEKKTLRFAVSQYNLLVFVMVWLFFFFFPLFFCKCKYLRKLE